MPKMSLRELQSKVGAAWGDMPAPKGVAERRAVYASDRAFLKAAARIPASSIEMNEPLRQDITIVSAQIAGNQETRIAWHVDRAPTEVVIGWTHAGHLVQESSVPPMPARQLRRLISRVPEIARVRGHGLEGAVAILFDEIAGQPGYFAGLTGAMRLEAAADGEPHEEAPEAEDSGLAAITDEADEVGDPVDAPA